MKAKETHCTQGSNLAAPKAILSTGQGAFFTTECVRSIIDDPGYLIMVWIMRHFTKRFIRARNWTPGRQVDYIIPGAESLRTVIRPEGSGLGISDHKAGRFRDWISYPTRAAVVSGVR